MAIAYCSLNKSIYKKRHKKLRQITGAFVFLHFSKITPQGFRRLPPPCGRQQDFAPFKKPGFSQAFCFRRQMARYLSMVRRRVSYARRVRAASVGRPGSPPDFRPASAERPAAPHPSPSAGGSHTGTPRSQNPRGGPPAARRAGESGLQAGQPPHFMTVFVDNRRKRTIFAPKKIFWILLDKVK